jgi:hypothetical protein
MALHLAQRGLGLVDGRAGNGAVEHRLDLVGST